MSGYLAGKLMYSVLLLLLLGLAWVLFLLLTNLLPAEHPLRKFLLAQTFSTVFPFASMVAIGILLVFFLGALILYG